MNTVKAIPLNYNITETHYSIYLTLRKSLVMSTEGFEGLQIVNQDLRIRRLEEANSNLSADLKKCHSAGGRGSPIFVVDWNPNISARTNYNCHYYHYCLWLLYHKDLPSRMSQNRAHCKLSSKA